MVTIYANKKTKKYHANRRGDQCRQGEIVAANRMTFSGKDEEAAVAAAEASGYKACRACYPE